MQVTEQDLREHYEGLETERLLELKAQGTLTETATRVLEQVLARRSLPTEEQAALEAQFRKQIAAQEELSASLASRWARLGAQIIDSMVAGIIMILSGLIWIAAPPLGILGFLLAALYLLLADGLPGGQSVGKRALDIAVIDQNTRQPCTLGQSFLRNFLSMALGGIDAIFIFGQKHQRLGDIAAKTLVVRLRPRVTAADSPEPSSPNA